MAISGFNEATLTEVLGSHLSPSQEIKDPNRLIGRERYLTQIRRALQSPGRHVFVYGERGVGKTSLAVTSGQIAVTERKNFIYLPCGESTSFYEVIAAIGKSTQSLDKRFSGSSFGFSAGVSVAGTGGNVSVSKSGQPDNRPSTLSEAMDVLRFVRSKLRGQIIVAIDEFDRISDTGEKTLFAELLKNVGSVVEDFRFIFCGIGADVDQILGTHLSVGRMFEPVLVEKLPHDSLWRIIGDVSEILKVDIDRGILLRIGVISDGFPHFVHLIGECLFYAMHDDPEVVSQCTRLHFDKALKEAIQKAEPSLRKIYQMATEKSEKKREYEEALWALADRSSTRRQIKEIYDSSYLRISEARGNHKNLPRETLNQRLLTLRKDSHANIVMGHGSGWFSFRENVVRGYVRLKAESEGVPLVPDPTN